MSAQHTPKPTQWCYAGCEGDKVRVVVVDLGPEVNAALRRAYQQPTNLSEMAPIAKATGGDA